MFVVGERRSPALISTSTKKHEQHQVFVVGERRSSALISTQPNMIPIPIQTTVQVPVPIAKNETKEIKRTLIIDTFDKGSRVEVAYV